MEIDIYCQLCMIWANGHWHNGVDIYAPKCPKCGSKKVNVVTDESCDSPRGDDEENGL